MENIYNNFLNLYNTYSYSIKISFIFTLMVFTIIFGFVKIVDNCYEEKNKETTE